MSKQVIWGKVILERFIEQANLTEEEEEVIRTRVAGWTIKKQAMELGMSESKISKIIARLKIKYDAVQKYDPVLPPRKNSVQELYMDSH